MNDDRPRYVEPKRTPEDEERLLAALKKIGAKRPSRSRRQSNSRRQRRSE